MKERGLTTELEYLLTVYEPEAEFAAGKIEERYTGEQIHSAWQEALILWFGHRRKEWHVRGRPALRINVSPGHFQVPDITLCHSDELQEQILTRPPIAVFEILSPDDRALRLFDKLERYWRMGVPNIIILEPNGSRHHRKYVDGKIIPLRERLVRLDQTSAFVDWREIEALLA